MEIFKIQIRVSLIVYAVIYLIKTFVLFKLTNPFEWFLILPKLAPSDRFAILLFLALYYFICYVCILRYVEDKNYEKEKR